VTNDAGDAGMAARPGDGEQKLAPLLAPGEAEDVSSRWESIQAGFVDQPRQAVREADALVSDLMGRLTRTFASERETLEEQWSEREEVSTEELRVALQRYRSFFERLISA
jgi:hypothetical protein